MNHFIWKLRNRILAMAPKAILTDEMLGERKNPYFNRSFSLSGEDMVVYSLVRKYYGYYIDVGAFHPWRYSNTYFFYLYGWTGITIDPNPQYIYLFNMLRKKDIHLQTAVSDKTQEMTYYSFNIPPYNGFSKEILKSVPGLKLIGEKKISVSPLEQILDKHVPKGKKIDFLSVDVEGFEMDVLKSNNWEKYRPQIVLAEVLDTAIEEAFTHPVTLFMKEKGYELVSCLQQNLVYRDAS